MKKLNIILISSLLSQYISAQSLAPATINSTARLSVKPSASLTASVGELTLQTPPQKKVATTDISKEESFIMEVYPNPSSDIVYFNFQKAGQGKITITLLNNTGQKLSNILDGNYDNGKISEHIDITNYASGMYFLSLKYTDASGKLFSSNKKFQILH